jgi:hypothetical protein
VRFRPDAAAGTVEILTYARLAEGHAEPTPVSDPTGQVTLSSAGAGPITLQIVPGSTELWGKCRPGVCVKGGDHIRVANGLTRGGVDLGPIGGFVPRDKNHGTEFTRYLVFKVRVLRLAR